MPGRIYQRTCLVLLPDGMESYWSFIQSSYYLRTYSCYLFLLVWVFGRLYLSRTWAISCKLPAHVLYAGCTGMGRCTSPCTPEKRSEQDIGYLSLIAFGLIVFTDSKAYRVSEADWSLNSQDLPVFVPQCWVTSSRSSAFPDGYMCARNSNSGPHGCRAISSVPNLNIFYWSLIFTTIYKTPRSCQNSNFIFSMPDAYAPGPLGSSSTFVYW